MNQQTLNQMTLHFEKDFGRVQDGTGTYWTSWDGPDERSGYNSILLGEEAGPGELFAAIRAIAQVKCMQTSQLVLEWRTRPQLEVTNEFYARFAVRLIAENETIDDSLEARVKRLEQAVDGIHSTLSVISHGGPFVG